jgi:uncharacterized protein YprB with RNaseH-like and TPR domain
MDTQTLSLQEKIQQYKTSPVIFVHIDTTGLGNDDELVRLTIIADDTIVYDEIYHSARDVTQQALRASGLTAEEIKESEILFKDKIETIESMIQDKLLVCINARFTQKFLLKAGLNISENNLLDLSQATDWFSIDEIKSSAEAIKFYGYDEDKSKNTFERNFIFYDCACKLKIMANVLLNKK